MRHRDHYDTFDGFGRSGPVWHSPEPDRDTTVDGDPTAGDGDTADDAPDGATDGADRRRRTPVRRLQGRAAGGEQQPEPDVRDDVAAPTAPPVDRRRGESGWPGARTAPGDEPTSPTGPAVDGNHTAPPGTPSVAPVNTPAAPSPPPAPAGPVVHVARQHTSEDSDGSPEGATPLARRHTVRSPRELTGEPEQRPWWSRGVRGALTAVAVVSGIVCTLLLVYGRQDDGAGHDGDRATAARTARPPAAPLPLLPSPAASVAPSTAPAPQGEVVVLDQSGVPGRAKAVAERLRAGGWTVTATAVFHGTVPATTVYHPAGREADARRLAAQFPEITRVRPSFPGITNARLVVIVVGGAPPTPPHPAATGPAAPASLTVPTPPAAPTPPAVPVVQRRTVPVPDAGPDSR